MDATLQDRRLRGAGSASRLCHLGESAALALGDELALVPKPGLVSFADAGSHQDMDALTFVRSISVLRPYFKRMVHLGYEGAPFAYLRHEGIVAEERMLQATRGINTHRGAIFSLGLLCASAGAAESMGRQLTPKAIQSSLLAHWGSALAAHAVANRASAGARLSQAHGLQSAGAEAAQGFPALFEVVYPALTQARKSGWSHADALLRALLRAISVLDDTNLVKRGGVEGLQLARASAQALLDAAPTAVLLRRGAWEMHAEFVRQRLSPGGAADMLAGAAWLHRVCVVDAG